jgi:predicted metal-dependent hydrolase
MRRSALPLPATRYLPGAEPRQVRPHAEPAAWATLDDAELWAYAVDLFNARYYWEAHEAWERLWRAAAPHSAEAAALKGLIQIAAALLKVQVGNEGAARRLASRGVALLCGAAERREALHGLRLAAVARAARARLIDVADPLTPEQVPFELELDT